MHCVAAADGGSTAQGRDECGQELPQELHQFSFYFTFHNGYWLLVIGYWFCEKKQKRTLLAILIFIKILRCCCWCLIDSKLSSSIITTIAALHALKSPKAKTLKTFLSLQIQQMRVRTNIIFRFGTNRCFCFEKAATYEKYVSDVGRKMVEACLRPDSWWWLNIARSAKLSRRVFLVFVQNNQFLILSPLRYESASRLLLSSFLISE